MLWAIPLAGAALGAMQGNARRQQEEKYNQAQAELHKYSPWTGMQGQIKPVQSSMFNGALQGGITGLGLMQGFGEGEVNPWEGDKQGTGPLMSYRNGR